MGVDFVVVGTPKSLQANPRGKRAWKSTVTKAAQSEAQLSLEVGQCRLHVYFFFDGKTDLDVDNIIKPISDALNQVAYVDDANVVDVHASKRDLNSPGQLVNPPPSVVAALAAGDDFVFVVVAPATSDIVFAQ